MILDHVSHSQFNMWDRCPRQWEFRYVMGLKIPPSGALIIGRSYHKALEVNFKQKVNSYVDLPVDDCLDAYSGEWENSIKEEERIEWEGRPGVLKDQGIELVTEYMSTTAFVVQPIRVEEYIVSEVAGVKFVLVLDTQDINKIVIDHKTSNRAYTQDSIDTDPQASATAFALNRPIVYYNHVAIKTLRPRIQAIRTLRTRAHIDWWLEKAVQIVSQMRSGIAPPREGGWWCSEKYCGFWQLCRGELAKRSF